MALAAPRKIETYGNTKPTYYGGQKGVPIKANCVVYHGALVSKATGAGWGPATAAASQVRFGIADLAQWSDLAPNGQKTDWGGTEYQKIDNTGGAAAARHFLAMAGIVRMKNKGGDAVTELMIGEVVHVEDDQTVRATATGSSPCGWLVGLCNDGTTDVWVKVDPCLAVA